MHDGIALHRFMQQVLETVASPVWSRLRLNVLKPITFFLRIARPSEIKAYERAHEADSCEPQCAKRQGACAHRSNEDNHAEN